MDGNERTEIFPETLQAWLEGQKPVEVIDIRPRADFEAWHIPGSRHVDAYQAIKHFQPGPLAGYEASDGKPVVVVCYVGQTSKLASQYLRGRGIPSLSLAGGMQGWSLAWNTAEVKLDGTEVQVVQVRRTGKGCLSYLVASQGEALVIDPALGPQVYRDLASEHGARIIAVLDTHVHADHLSRARLLAQATGAELLLPQQDRVAYDHTPVVEGAMLTVGAVELQAISTPGHTFESMSFLLPGTALFTGDTLFLASVGRPDLKAGEAETAARARALHATLQALAALDRDLMVLPGHTSMPVPFDRQPITARLGDVAARIAALAFGEEQFVTWILGRIPPNPPNYEHIVAYNEAGLMPMVDPSILEAGANRCAI
jgi:glyoxylase-like metal-dependent hydrolase (beta-lactamase superfamily II)/rhodanese-related sulfurtransferase